MVGDSYFGGSKGDFPPAPGAASDSAIVAGVADAVRKLGFEADVASSVKFNASCTLQFVSRTNRLLQYSYFVLFPSGVQNKQVSKKINKYCNQLFSRCRCH